MRRVRLSSSAPVLYPPAPTACRASRTPISTARLRRADEDRSSPALAPTGDDPQPAVRPRRWMPESPQAASAGRTVPQPDPLGCRTPVPLTQKDASEPVFCPGGRPRPALPDGSAESRRKCRRAPSGSSPPWDVRQLRLSATKGSEPFAGLTRNQSLQTCPHQGGLLVNPGQVSGTRQ